MNIPTEWCLIFTETEIASYVKKCADYLNHKFSNDDVVVVCILKGAAYFYVDLTRMLTIPHSCYFIEASSYKDSQKQCDQLEILSIINPEKFRGKKVILIDELYDNGCTMYNIKNAISEKAKVALDDIFTCTAFKKNKETSFPQPDLCGVTTPDVWLVGYGLDVKQRYRNLKELYGCPKTEDIPKTVDDIRIFG